MTQTLQEDEWSDHRLLGPYLLFEAHRNEKRIAVVRQQRVCIRIWRERQCGDAGCSFHYVCAQRTTADAPFISLSARLSTIFGMGFIRMGTICAGACIALAALGGCTPGAAVAPSQNAASSNATIIGMSLLKYGQSQSPLGFVQAYNPAFVTIAVGSAIQFHNDDGFAHTATMISGSFPNSNPFQTVALTASGSDLAAAAWSTGDIP